MKTLMVIIAVITLFAATPFIVAADDIAGPMGSAPNSGDGISDGSGLDAPNGTNGDPGTVPESIGPAPNSGDGISDGSGF